jgi:UDP-4-amino-4,6-dideoxy-N-acetyl-beta-L-altrosamine transaminase
MQAHSQRRYSYSMQSISNEDKEAVLDVLNSDFLTQGPAVPEFENTLTKIVGAKHGVAVNSGTSALHIACLALGVGPGDTVWTSPNTFVASANCGRLCGADVDFVDIDGSTGNICVAELEKKLVLAHKNGTLPKVVIPVHFAGQPTNQERIWNLAQEFGFYVIEDASHSLGSRRKGNTVGNCAHSNITVFSFHPVKIITTGEGGVALTNDSTLADRMAKLRCHGITRDQKEMVLNSQGPWYYEQLSLGLNYRMTDIQAALGISQLNRLNQFVGRRNEIAIRYDKALMDHAIKRLVILEGNYSARHLYVIRVPANQRLKLFKTLRNEGMGVNLHYMPVHLQPYYRNLGFKEGNFSEAERHGREAISLPLYPDISDDELQSTIENIITFFE